MEFRKPFGSTALNTFQALDVLLQPRCPRCAGELNPRADYCSIQAPKLGRIELAKVPAQETCDLVGFGSNTIALIGDIQCTSNKHSEITFFVHSFQCIII